MKDYYTTLGVRENSTLQEIKAAYRSLARKFHPDKNPNPEAVQKFKEITKAYKILSDPEMRNRYNVMLKRSDNGDMLDFIGGINPLSDFDNEVADLIGEGGLEDFLGLSPISEFEQNSAREKSTNEMREELLKEAAQDPELREYLKEMNILPKDINL